MGNRGRRVQGEPFLGGLKRELSDDPSKKKRILENSIDSDA